MIKTKMVRWRLRGTYFCNGIAHTRAPGDVDELPGGQAENLSRCGYVDIIGKEVSKIVEIMGLVIKGNSE